MNPPPLGYASAHRVVALGRTACFRHALDDLPEASDQVVAENDKVPQFGYVGTNYPQHRVLLLGINPGNGPRHTQNKGDTVVMPHLKRFFADRSVESFVAAQSAYRSVCEGWFIWGRECDELLRAAGLGLDDIAFTNALPWRTGSRSAFSKYTAKRAAEVYVAPLVRELAPRVLVAVGKRVVEMLEHAGAMSGAVVVWNRAQALQPHVVREREAAREKLAKLLRSA